MAQEIIEPQQGKYVLEGRLVTMGSRGVLPKGAIYIDSGEIMAVQDARENPPDGFANTPRIATGDSIYPGLIELHNHLSYNAIPLWDVPQKFVHNGRWRDHDDYTRLITKPCMVLGNTPGIPEALVRFVECRCLLGGVTSSQGITLASAPTVRKLYKGLVRNVEQPLDDNLPGAGTRIANPQREKALDYLDNLKKHTCYLQHLSEGLGETPRGWFLNLHIADDEWAITDAFCGIHSTALTAEDFRVLSRLGGTMVWSPLSNFLLYGATADIRAAKEAKVLMALGSDWAPSGSKNLLGELKVAYLVSKEHGDVFVPEELVQMVTVNAAKILKWDQRIGTIEPGKRADLLVINGQQGDDYLRLIEARETTITLVTIDGVPRVGQRRFMNRFGGNKEAIRIDDAERLLYLEHDDPDTLAVTISLADATERLRNALLNLQELAGNLDNAVALGLIGGNVNTNMPDVPWRVVFELEEESFNYDMAAEPLVDLLQSMHLEAITVADDRTFLPKIVAARNVPEFIKKQLPPLYGRTIPLPDSASFLRQLDPANTPDELLSTTQDLKTFLRTTGELHLDDCRRIVDQALLVIEQHYVHLPLKRAMHAVDPVQRLKLVRYRLDELWNNKDADEPFTEIDLHDELTHIFNSLRDLHTNYRLPVPFMTKFAWLPFMIEEFWEAGQRRYLVTRVVSDVGPASFQAGVEALYWNGMPLRKAVLQNAEREAGSNRAAREARGLNSLTFRPLARGLPPVEEWVTLRYRARDEQEYELTQEWLVFEPGRGPDDLNPGSGELNTAFLGLDASVDDIQLAKKLLFASEYVMAGKRAEPDQERQAVLNVKDGQETFLPTVFRAKKIAYNGDLYGYIRIFTFNFANVDEFLNEFIRLVRELPQQGLVIDVRGNPGGHIHAAERLLQTLTPNKIQPQKAQFINSMLNLRICRDRDDSDPFQSLHLDRWQDSIAQSVETGATYSHGYSITPEELCNDIGQQYYGPVVLIVDALCYSATDMFAAGFKDHRIGEIVGVHGNTGAGGANVWPHGLLYALMAGADGESPEDAFPLLPLPHGADLRVAMRRTLRVGDNAGTPVEDFGIIPDVIHKMTRQDIEGANEDLIATAASLLAQKPTYGLAVTYEQCGYELPCAVITMQNIDRLDVFLDARPVGTFNVSTDTIRLDFAEFADSINLANTSCVLEIQGFMNNHLVASYRADLRDQPTS